jgi:hypothetical protein
MILTPISYSETMQNLLNLEVLRSFPINHLYDGKVNEIIAVRMANLIKSIIPNSWEKEIL